MQTTKSQGPIRTGVVIPVTIIFVVSFFYFHFLFDQNVRRAIEWVGTTIQGAEVNVGSFKSSFIDGSFSLKDLQITNKENPKQNLLEIGEIRFAMLWDALLRFKFVIEDAGIEDIRLYTNRQKPGYVAPPEPPSDKPSALAQLESQVTGQAQKQFAGNVLGDVAALIDGVDEKELHKKIQSELKAEDHIKTLKQELQDKEKSWKARIEALPKKEEFRDLADRAKKLKFETSNPKQFANDLKELGKITKEADAKIDAFKSSSQDLKADLEKFDSDFKKIDDLVKQDLKDLEARLKLPDLDVADFSKSLFGNMLSSKLVDIRKYMAVMRQYLPPPKDPKAPKEPDLIPPKRGKGKTYMFPVTTGYPLFWLKKASISSNASTDGFSGDVSGQLTDVSTDPTFVKRPMVLEVKGNFPQAQVLGTELKLVVDHIQTPKETLALKVDQFPIPELPLNQSPKLSLSLEKATGSSRFLVELSGRNVSVDLNNNLKNLNYKIESSSNKIKEAIQGILTGIPNITLNGSIKGTWSNLDFSLNSNLGRELSQGLQEFARAKVDNLKSELRKSIDEKIGAERKKLDTEYAKIKASVDGALKDKGDEINKAKDELKSETQGQKSSSKDKAKQELKEKGKKLLKGIKF